MVFQPFSAINTSRMHLGFRCIEGWFLPVLGWPERRWKSASQCGMTHNAGIFHLKNHWIAPATHSVLHNPYTEIRKAASAENDIDPREYQGNGHIPTFLQKSTKKAAINSQLALHLLRLLVLWRQWPPHPCCRWAPRCPYPLAWWAANCRFPRRWKRRQN